MCTKISMYLCNVVNKNYSRKVANNVCKKRSQNFGQKDAINVARKLQENMYQKLEGTSQDRVCKKRARI